MRVEIMWGEPQHAFIDIGGCAPESLSNQEIDTLCRAWVEEHHPDFDSWDWKRASDD